MTDASEQSIPSRGSHGPVSVSVHLDKSACGLPDSRPLRRTVPTLTEDERDAIAFLLRHAAVAADGWAFADSADYRRHHDAVFGLLERTK